MQQQSRKTALFAGFATDAYLSSLQKFEQHAPQSTAAYLDSLSRFSAYDVPTPLDSTIFDSALPSLTMSEATTGTTDSLANQLSGLSYDSLADAANPREIASLAQKMAENSPDVFTSIQAARRSADLSGWTERLQGAGEAVTSSTVSALKSVAAAEKQLVASASANVQAAADHISLSDLGEGTVQAAKSMGATLMVVLNALLESTAHQSLGQIVSKAQASVQGVIDGAVTSVTQTITEIGNKSVAEAAQSFVALIVFLAKLFYKLLNGVIQLATGKEMLEWAQIAGSTLATQATQLGQAAAEFAVDLSHKSLTQLLNMLAGFANAVGDALVANAGTAWSLAEGASSTALL